MTYFLVPPLIRQKFGFSQPLNPFNFICFHIFLFLINQKDLTTSQISKIITLTRMYSSIYLLKIFIKFILKRLWKSLYLTWLQTKICCHAKYYAHQQVILEQNRYVDGQIWMRSFAKAFEWTSFKGEINYFLLSQKVRVIHFNSLAIST